MKQIRLKDMILKIEKCGDCPICDPPYWHCSLKVRLHEENVKLFCHEDCPLEEYDLALSIKQTNDSIKFIE